LNQSNTKRCPEKLLKVDFMRKFIRWLVNSTLRYCFFQMKCNVELTRQGVNFFYPISHSKVYVFVFYLCYEIVSRRATCVTLNFIGKFNGWRGNSCDTDFLVKLNVEFMTHPFNFSWIPYLIRNFIFSCFVYAAKLNTRGLPV